MVAWILTAVLAIIAALFIALYRRSIKESQCLTALLIQVLLDRDTYNFQRDGLSQLVLGMQAANALDLSTKVQLSVAQLALRLGGSVMLASHGLLWKLKQEGSGSSNPASA
jgi:hypothetical protein